MNRDAYKRTCLIGAFIRYLAHFWLAFLELFLGGGVQNCTLPFIMFLFYYMSNKIDIISADMNIFDDLTIFVMSF